MSLIIALTAALLLWATFFSPWIKQTEVHSAVRYAQRLKNFKIIAIKKYHPLFQSGQMYSDFDYWDIESRFNVDSLYEQIGL